MSSNSSNTYVLWHSNDCGNSLVSIPAFCSDWIKYAYNFQFHFIGSYLWLCRKVLHQHSRWRREHLGHMLGGPLFHPFTRKLLSVCFVSHSSWSYFNNRQQGGCFVPILGSPVHILCCAAAYYSILHWLTSICFSLRLEGPFFSRDKSFVAKELEEWNILDAMSGTMLFYLCQPRVPLNLLEFGENKICWIGNCIGSLPWWYTKERKCWTGVDGIVESQGKNSWTSPVVTGVSILLCWFHPSHFHVKASNGVTFLVAVNLQSDIRYQLLCFAVCILFEDARS